MHAYHVSSALRSAGACLRAWAVAGVLIVIVALTGIGSAERIAPASAEARLTALAWQGADLCGEHPGKTDHGCPLCLVSSPPEPAGLKDAEQRLLNWRAPVLRQWPVRLTRAPPLPPARAPPMFSRTA